MAEDINGTHNQEDIITPLAIDDEVHGFSLPDGFQYTLHVLITIHLILSIVLNNFNIRILRREDCGFEYRARQYAMALAVTDQLCALTMICFNFVKLIWSQDTHTCVYLFIIQHAFNTLSNTYMASWSGDRFLQIWKPFLYERFVTKSISTISLIFSTMACFAFSIGQLVSWKDNPTMINECFPDEIKMTGKKVWIVLTFFLPVVMTIFCTCTQVATLKVTFTKIHAETRLQPHIGGNIPQGDHRPFRKRYLKGVRTVLILILTTYFVALPAITIRITRDTSNLGHFSFIAFQFVTFTSFINTWWKPFIFLMTNKQYRSTAKQERHRLWSSCSSAGN